MYSLIRRAAFEPSPDSTQWRPELHLLRFPDELATVLKTFHRSCVRRGADYHLPVKALNGLLQAAVPGVLAIGRGTAADESVPWLYAREPVPADLVKALLNTWVMQWPSRKRSAELEGRLKEALGAIGDIGLQWTSESVDLFASDHSLGGTAIPDRRLFALLPEQIGFRLAADAFGVGADTLPFRVVTTEQGTEIVSWPPLFHTRNGVTWRYSATVKITVHTAPFTVPFRIHATSGIRRWVTQGPVDLRSRSATVLFDVPSPWAPAAERRRRLIRNTVVFDDDQDCYVWKHGSPAVLLSQLDLTRSYPEANSVIAEPGRWLGGVGGVAAGLVFSEGIADHGVAAGLMPAERRRLDEWVESRLAPGLCRVPDMERVVKNSKPRLASGSGRKRSRHAALVERRRAALIAALGGDRLDVEVLWQGNETMDCLVASLRELLDLPPTVVGDRGSVLWEDDGLSIRIHGRRAGALVEKLAVPRRRSPEGKVVRRAVRLAKAIRDRRREVSRAVGPAADPVVAVRSAALVEIGGPRRFAGDTDPKFAVRLGLADVGRVSQFFLIGADTKTPLKTRATGIWVDLFRQLGALHLPPPRVASRMPANLQYLGVWMLNRRSDGPTRASAERLIAVRVRPDDPRFPVRVWDRDHNSWVPYPDFLVGLARDVRLGDDDLVEPADTDDPHESSDLDADYELGDAERDLRTVLYQVGDRPTLMLLNSGNLRFAVPGIGNEHLVPDMIRFGDAPAQRVAAFGPDLRLVLIRDHSGRDETPQWYAPDPEDPDGSRTGFSAGLWRPVGSGDCNRLFASTTDVPKLLKRKPRGLRKLFPTASAPTAPAKSAWNPRLLEITVLGCVTSAVLHHADRDEEEADTPDDYAGIAHQLRFHEDFDPLGLPIVQHWAKKAVEYLLPLAEAGA